MQLSNHGEETQTNIFNPQKSEAILKAKKAIDIIKKSVPIITCI